MGTVLEQHRNVANRVPFRPSSRTASCPCASSKPYLPNRLLFGVLKECSRTSRPPAPPPVPSSAAAAARRPLAVLTAAPRAPPPPGPAAPGRTPRRRAGPRAAAATPGCTARLSGGEGEGERVSAHVCVGYAPQPWMATPLFWLDNAFLDMGMVKLTVP